jgi:hypothetical protein
MAAAPLAGAAGASAKGAAVQIDDRRSAGSAPLRMERATLSDGKEQIRLIIGGKAEKRISEGVLDPLLSKRYGIKGNVIR